MRDDFSKQIKEVLSQRVGLHCSNPNCNRITYGPNSEQKKATNIGVAAHITAASLKGPRYNTKFTPDERKSIDNAIWLCQSCAKLIDSDEEKYSVDLLKNWKKIAEQYAEERMIHPNSNSDTNHGIFTLMPELIQEMADDLINNPLAREFVLLGKNWAFNNTKGVLYYYYEEHDQLDNKIRILENNNLIEDITYNNTKRYVFTEEFVRILKNIKL